MADFTNEIKKRRTFAIISHPDAGKTTLTEKFQSGRFCKRKGNSETCGFRLDGD